MSDHEAKIKIRDVSKLFGRRKDDAQRMLDDGHTKEEVLAETGVTVALDKVSFDVPAGRLFVVMGLSGSGKSTLIRCINRLIEPTSGSIELDGRDVLAMDDAELRRLRREKLGMVFQHFALLPHRTVVENVAYGLEIQGVDEDERRARAAEVIETVGLKGWGDSYPASLSGGMQQRVGLARALAIDPDILLMDEPFSALDPLVRREMQEELINLQERVRKTILFITHDLDEAIKLGAQMAILRGGAVVQVGVPEDILRDPADDYVKSFVEDVDPSRIMRAKDIMVDPVIRVRADHTPGVSLRMMEREEMSSAFVVGPRERLLGILTADSAAEAAQRDGDREVGDLQLVDAGTVAPDTPLRELMPMAADEPYPLAVVDDDGRLVGTIRWVSIVRGLARSMREEPEEIATMDGDAEQGVDEDARVGA